MRNKLMLAASVAGVTGIIFAGVWQKKNGTIIGIGDSMTRAVLADTELRDKNKWYSEAELQEDDDWEWQNAGVSWYLRLMFDRPWLSWSTSNQPYSVKSKLKMEKRYNFAISGALTFDLLGEHGIALKHVEPGQMDVLATVLIGGNDLCRASWSAWQAKEKLDEYFSDVLVSTSWKFVFMDLPPLYQLTKFNDYPAMAGATCKKLKEVTGHFCGEILLEWTDEQRLIRQKEFKQVWDEIGMKYEQLYPERFVYSKVFEEVGEVKAEWMAKDCFHTSIKGHKLIADIVSRDARKIWDIK